MLPTFLVIGAMKAGTTSLHDYLSRHPGVFMSQRKELNFFSAQHNWDKGLDWYRSQFADARPGMAVGEASPGYTMFPFFPGIAARVAAVLPSVKLVYVVREPIARMRSEYVHARANGFERRPIERALLERSRYVLLSSYALQLDQYLEHFPADDVLVITADDLHTRRAETLTTVLRHIGVQSDTEVPDLHRELNRGEGKRVARINSYRFNTALALRTERWPRRVVAVRDAVTSRPFRSDELQISAAVAGRLRTTLRPDLERLRAHLPSTFKGWPTDPDVHS